jgi:hypothetical protein
MHLAAQSGLFEVEPVQVPVAALAHSETDLALLPQSIF